MYYKNVQDGFIVGIGTANGTAENEISEQEYNAILDALKNRPKDTPEVIYRITEQLEYIPFTIEPEEPEVSFDNEDFVAGYQQALIDLLSLEEE